MDEGELIKEFMLLTAALKSEPAQTSNKLQEAFEVLADILAWNPPSKSILLRNNILFQSGSNTSLDFGY
ncbi:MAG: hypothetical protein PHY05_07180 [Methanothrix sp.]|nr:hypothetical protein [Methanothrix sp.]